MELDVVGGCVEVDVKVDVDVTVDVVGGAEDVVVKVCVLLVVVGF